MSDISKEMEEMWYAMKEGQWYYTLWRYEEQIDRELLSKGLVEKLENALNGKPAYRKPHLIRIKGDVVPIKASLAGKGKVKVMPDGSKMVVDLEVKFIKLTTIDLEGLRSEDTG